MLRPHSLQELMLWVSKRCPESQPKIVPLFHVTGRAELPAQDLLCLSKTLDASHSAVHQVNCGEMNLFVGAVVHLTESPYRDTQPHRMLCTAWSCTQWMAPNFIHMFFCENSQWVESLPPGFFICKELLNSPANHSTL